MTHLQRARRLLTREDAATSVEYCVMLALILLVLIVGVTAAGSGVSGWWSNNDAELQSHGF